MLLRNTQDLRRCQSRDLRVLTFARVNCQPGICGRRVRTHIHHVAIKDLNALKLLQLQNTMPVNISSLAELKNGSDDAIPMVLKKLGYKQSFTYMDIRLLFGYIGVIAAALAGAYDYKFGFEKAKGFTLIGVVIYFIFYGAMNAWQYFVEKGTVYVGWRDDTRILIKSSTDKTSPMYKITITIEQPGAAPQSQVFQESFTKWFDVDGNIVLIPFTTWINAKVQQIQKLAIKKRN